MTTPPPRVVHVAEALLELKRRRDEAKVPTQATPRSPTVGDGDPVVITDPQAYVDAAMRRLVDELARHTKGSRNAAAHEAARSVGRMVGAGLPLEGSTACVALLDACKANGLVADDGEHSAIASIRSGYLWGHDHPLAWVQGTTPPSATPLDDTAWLNAANPAIANGVVDLEGMRAAAIALEAEKLRARRQAARIVDAEDSAAAYVRVQLKRGDEFLREPDPPIVWAITDLAQRGHNVLLTAQYKTGKTTLVGNLIRSICDGVPFLEHFDVALDLGRVASLDYELDAAQHRRWLRDIEPIQADKLVVGHWRGVRGRFDDEQNIADLIDQLGTADVGVMVIDPFAAAAKGVDENDNGAVGAWLNVIDYIKLEAGVHTAILVTHTGRREAEVGQERARGATRLDDWPDVRWLLSKNDDGVRFFGADGRDVHVETGQLVYDEARRSYAYTGNTPAILAARGLEDLVLDYVAANPGTSGNAIETDVTGSRDRIRKAIKHLVGNGRLADVGVGQAHKYVIGRARTTLATPFEPDLSTSPENLA